MSSGQRRVVFNTRERVLSTDANRVQSIVAQSRSQLERFRSNDEYQNWFVNSGVAVQNIGGETPMAADVFGGFLLLPLTNNLLIEPGTIGCLFLDPAITADDSPYMVIDDPGVQSTGVLTFTATGGAGTRVDLIECQPVEVTSETDSRDIFDPGTGLFTPTNVPKVKSFQLQYRIRLGTPGSGLPTLVSGWVPLAVAVVQNASTSFDNTDFYDVRPLVQERVLPQPIAGFTPGYYPIERAEWRLFGQTLSGFAFASFNGYPAGGELRTNTANFGTFGGTGAGDSENTHLNLAAAGNLAPGFAHSADRLNYLVACFPGNLPRWVRYSQVPQGGGFGRVPRGPRGIVFVTSSTATASNGFVQVTASVFGASQPCVVLATLKSNAAGSGFSSCNTQDRLTLVAEPKQFFGSALPSTQSVDFVFTEGTHYPSSARVLRLRFQLLINIADGNPLNIDAVLRESGNTIDLAVVGNFNSSPYPVAVFTAQFTIDVPIQARNGFNVADVTATNTVRLSITGTLSTLISPATSQQQVKVLGWRDGS